MKNRFWKVLAVVLGVAALTIASVGCDLLGDDGESDGTLTATLAGFTGSCGEPLEAYFMVFVVPGGTVVDMENGDDPLAGGFAPITDEPVVSATAKVFDENGPTETNWKGTGGKRYDVYPTIYCVDPAALESGAFNPGDPGPVAVYKAADFSQPVSYTQDGNKTIDTLFSDYVEGPGSMGNGE